MTFKDDYGNTARIIVDQVYPYKGASKKETSFKLIISADYENDDIYFVSRFDDIRRLLAKLSSFSCGTFKGIDNSLHWEQGGLSND